MLGCARARDRARSSGSGDVPSMTRADDPSLFAPPSLLVVPRAYAYRLLDARRRGTKRGKKG